MDKWPLQHPERLIGVDEVLCVFARRVPDVLGGRWGIGRGVTTDAEQIVLWNKGRVTKGEPPYTEKNPLGLTVTEAKTATDTAHGVRIYGANALDFIAFNDGGTPDWTPPRYLKLGEFAKRCSLEWGGDFKKRDPRTGLLRPMPDLGHVQIVGWRAIPITQPRTS